jgi:hypothetical protein
MKPSNGVPNATEFGKVRAYLARAEVSQVDIKKHLEDLPAGATRVEITESLKRMCRNFPRHSDMMML